MEEYLKLKEEAGKQGTALQMQLDKVLFAFLQSMPGDMCKFRSTSKKSPLPTSLSAVQSHMPNRNFVVTTATLVTVTFYFHNCTLSRLFLNETFNMYLEQQTLYFRYKILDRSCRQSCISELTLLHVFLPGMDCFSMVFISLPSLEVLLPALLGLHAFCSGAASFLRKCTLLFCA